MGFTSLPKPMDARVEVSPEGIRGHQEIFRPIPGFAEDD